MSTDITLDKDTFDKLGSSTEKVREVKQNLEGIGRELLNDLPEKIPPEKIEMKVSRVSKRGESSPRNHMWLMFARDAEDKGFPELIHPEILVGEDNGGPYAALRFNAEQTEEQGRDAEERDRLASRISEDPSGFIQYLQHLDDFEIKYKPKYRDEVSKRAEEVTGDDLEAIKENGLTSLLIKRRYRPDDEIFSSRFIQDSKRIFHDVFFPMLVEYAFPKSHDIDLTDQEFKKNEENKVDTSYFILKTGSGEYEDVPSEHYHFEKGIPGSNQIRDPNRIKFVYLQDKEFYAKGEIGDIESEERDGEIHYFAEIKNYEEIDPVDFDKVRELIAPDFPKQYGIIKIPEQDYRLIIEEGDRGFDLQSIFDEVSRPNIYQDALAHLVAGKNVVFYGPPGTGKTRAARIICEAICRNFELETANAEWSNYQVVGGYRPTGSEWEPSPGFLAQAAQECKENMTKSPPQPTWLIIDEMNRANLDEAFGDVFTLLDLDYRNAEPLYADTDIYMPLSFRILATMNTYDQAQLFSLGYAFRRRFAFVRVPSLLEDREEKTETEELVPSTEPELADSAAKLVELIEEAAVESMSRGSQGEGIVEQDVAAIFPEFADEEVIKNALEDILNDPNLRTDGLTPTETLVYFCTEVTNRDLIDIGQALLIDAMKYIIAHQLLFPESTSKSTLDDAIVAYIVPQFEYFMSDLRRAETIDQDSDAGELFDEVVQLAEDLSLPETAAILEEAKETKQLLA